MLLSSCFRALELAFFCFSVKGRFRGSESPEACPWAAAGALLAAGVAVWLGLPSAGVAEGAAESWATAKTVERTRTNNSENDHIGNSYLILKLLLNKH